MTTMVVVVATEYRLCLHSFSSSSSQLELIFPSPFFIFFAIIPYVCFYLSKCLTPIANKTPASNDPLLTKPSHELMNEMSGVKYSDNQTFLEMVEQLGTAATVKRNLIYQSKLKNRLWQRLYTLVNSIQDYKVKQLVNSSFSPFQVSILLWGKLYFFVSFKQIPLCSIFLCPQIFSLSFFS